MEAGWRLASGPPSQVWKDASANASCSSRAFLAQSYSGSTGLKVFSYLVYLSVVAAAIPYFISACAQLAYLISAHEVAEP